MPKSPEENAAIMARIAAKENVIYVRLAEVEAGRHELAAADLERRDPDTISVVKIDEGGNPIRHEDGRLITEERPLSLPPRVGIKSFRGQLKAGTVHAGSPEFKPDENGRVRRVHALRGKAQVLRDRAAALKV